MVVRCDPQLVRDDLRERRLAQPGRTGQQDVVERLVAPDAPPRSGRRQVLLDPCCPRYSSSRLGRSERSISRSSSVKRRRDQPLGLVLASVARLPRSVVTTRLPSRLSACLSSACDIARDIVGALERDRHLRRREAHREQRVASPRRVRRHSRPSCRPRARATSESPACRRGRG